MTIDDIREYENLKQKETNDKVIAGLQRQTSRGSRSSSTDWPCEEHKGDHSKDTIISWLWVDDKRLLSLRHPGRVEKKYIEQEYELMEIVQRTFVDVVSILWWHAAPVSLAGPFRISGMKVMCRQLKIWSHTVHTRTNKAIKALIRWQHTF